MKNQLSQTGRRVGVLLSFITLISAVILFEFCIKNGWSSTLIAFEIGLAALFIFSYINTFLRTGIWQFSHKKIKNLDEREMVVTGKSLRISYSIFTIVTVIFIFALAITNLSISGLTAFAILIFAHILPASIIAWNTKHI